MIKIYQKLYEARPIEIDASDFGKFFSEYLVNVRNIFSFLEENKDIWEQVREFDRIAKTRDFTRIKKFIKERVDKDLFFVGPDWESIVCSQPVSKIKIEKVDGTNRIVEVYISFSPIVRYQAAFYDKGSKIFFNVPFNEKIKEMIKVARSAEDILYHELIHSKDVIEKSKEKSKTPEEYYNKRTEIKSHLSQICIINKQEIIKLLNKGEKSYKEILEYILDRDSTYKHISKFFYPKTKNYFLKGILTFIEDLDNQRGK